MIKRKRFCVDFKLMVMFNYDYKCGSCKCMLPPTFELDHKIPLHDAHWKTMDTMSAYRDANDINNIWPLCTPCHSKKTQQERINRMQSRINKPHVSHRYCLRCRKTVSIYFKHKCFLINDF